MRIDAENTLVKKEGRGGSFRGGSRAPIFLSEFLSASWQDSKMVSAQMCSLIVNGRNLFKF